MTDTAEVNPDDTGPETKSNKNPNPNAPIMNSMMPLRKHSNTVFGTFPFVMVNVRRADMAEGPIGTSLQLPRNIYTIAPRNDPYKPYCN